MIPSAFVMLPALPLTANGKIDRRALPSPLAMHSETAASAPRTETEKAVASIWRELLATEQVGIDDNFFDLGGHSLLATRLISRIRSTLGVELAIRTLFEAPTVAQLAEHVDSALWLRSEPDEEFAEMELEGVEL